jgi:hypothetical protein
MIAPAMAADRPEQWKITREQKRADSMTGHRFAGRTTNASRHEFTRSRSAG